MQKLRKIFADRKIIIILAVLLVVLIGVIVGVASSGNSKKKGNTEIPDKQEETLKEDN